MSTNEAYKEFIGFLFKGALGKTVVLEKIVIIAQPYMIREKWIPEIV